MSLAPGERRALARIEESLCRSDPELADVLTKFSLPVWRDGWNGLTRRLRRFLPFIPVVVAVAVALSFILVIELSAAAPLPCGHSGRASAVSIAHDRGCPPPIPSGDRGVPR